MDAPEFGTKFGHEEQRQGDVAQGRYYVQLPDGRTQVVEYTADQDGFKPKISYEGEANGSGNGYGRGPGGQGGQGGYPGGQGGQGGYAGGQGGQGGYPGGQGQGSQGGK